MKDSLALDRPTRDSLDIPIVDGLCRQLVVRAARHVSQGRLTIIDAEGQQRFGPRGGLSAQLEVHDSRFYRLVALRGSIGLGEAYGQGYFSTDDLCKLVQLGLQNPQLTGALDSGVARLTAPIDRFMHAARRNTLSGSRRNVGAHYDLGNEFYQLWLDRTLSYSAAIFPSAGASLEEASLYKLDRVCQKLDLGPGDELLEIGSGWGALAMHAAKHYGCRVTTTTISKAQHVHCEQAFAASGLADRITLQHVDYRELSGRYDKIASIEMIEAIGHENYRDFFARAARLLKPHGLMLLQSITIPDHRYETAKDEVDFIKRYIFPGSCIPSLAALTRAMAQASDFRVLSLEDISEHYARTLSEWCRRLLEQRDAISSLGYERDFIRTWEFYLRYCEAGFRERYIGDAQILLARPGCRTQIPTPGLRSSGREA